MCNHAWQSGVVLGRLYAPPGIPRMSARLAGVALDKAKKRSLVRRVRGSAQKNRIPEAL